MTGSLQIKNGLYYAVLNFQDHNGKRKLKWFSTGLPEKNNKKRAEKILQQLISEWSDKKIEYESLTVAAYFKEWLERQRREVSPNTFRGYQSNMMIHIIPYFEEQGTKLLQLKAYQLEDYYHSKLRTESDSETGLSPTSIKHHHQNISKALHDAVRREILLYNPASAARTPKAQRFVGTFLNPSQLIELASQFHGEPTEIPMLLIITYGMRRSEALALTWNCVDFEQRQFTIASALLQNTGGDYIRKSTKSDSSYRTLPMTQQMFLILQKHKALQSENRKLMGNGYQQSDYICTWPDGTPSLRLII